MRSILEKFYREWLPHDIQDSTNPRYYGFADKDGAWYIIENQSDTTFRYAGEKNNTSIANYAEAWTNRETLTYGYIYQAV